MLINNRIERGSVRAITKFYKFRITEMDWVALLKPLGQKFEVNIRV